MLTGQINHKDAEYKYELDLTQEDIYTYYVNTLFKEICEHNYPELLKQVKIQVSEMLENEN